jgi:hypothetical protein
LLHTYEVPPVAVTLIAVLVQVSSVEPVVLVIPAGGAVVFEVTVILAVDVQPLALLTVTVYVPGAVILASADVPSDPLHEYEVPPVADTLIAVVEHVSIVEPVLLVMPAVGNEFIDTVVDAVDVHPEASVAVTVYVPAFVELELVIEGFCVVVAKAEGPLQLYVTAPFAPVALAFN